MVVDLPSGEIERVLQSQCTESEEVVNNATGCDTVNKGDYHWSSERRKRKSKLQTIHGKEREGWRKVVSSAKLFSTGL